jgi:hypothetical protein
MAEKAKLKYAVPKTIGPALDLLHKVREGRKALAAKAEAEKAQEALIEVRILEMFKKGDLEGAAGKQAKASIKRSPVPVIEDFNLTWTWAKKNDAPEIFQRRLSSEACRERWDQGQTIPGVGTFDKVSLHLTPIKKKK